MPVWKFIICFMPNYLWDKCILIFFEVDMHVLTYGVVLYCVGFSRS